MRRPIFTLVTALLLASFATDSSAQQYDRLLGAPSNLQATLQRTLATQAAVPRVHPTIADTDGEVVSARVPTIDDNLAPIGDVRRMVESGFPQITGALYHLDDGYVGGLEPQPDQEKIMAKHSPVTLSVKQQELNNQNESANAFENDDLNNCTMYIEPIRSYKI